MFTGIIERCGRVLEFERKQGGVTIELLTEFEDLSIGESLAVNGVCLTVEKTVSSHAVFFLSSETLSKTQLGSLRVDDIVNLERAVTPQTRLSGHWVQGHVDGVGTIRSIESAGDSKLVVLELPKEFLKYVTNKGSITVDGISLTVNALRDAEHSVELMIIPHTWSNTNLHSLNVPSKVNVEVDALSKIVERLCQFPKP